MYSEGKTDEALSELLLPGVGDYREVRFTRSPAILWSCLSERCGWGNEPNLDPIRRKGWAIAAGDDKNALFAGSAP